MTQPRSHVSKHWYHASFSICVDFVLVVPVSCESGSMSIPTGAFFVYVLYLFIITAVCEALATRAEDTLRCFKTTYKNKSICSSIPCLFYLHQSVEEEPKHTYVHPASFGAAHALASSPSSSLYHFVFAWHDSEHKTNSTTQNWLVFFCHLFLM